MFSWMAGSSPAMTENGILAPPTPNALRATARREAVAGDLSIERRNVNGRSLGSLAHNLRREWRKEKFFHLNRA